MVIGICLAISGKFKALDILWMFFYVSWWAFCCHLLFVWHYIKRQSVYRLLWDQSNDSQELFVYLWQEVFVPLFLQNNKAPNRMQNFYGGFFILQLFHGRSPKIIVSGSLSSFSYFFFPYLQPRLFLTVAATQERVEKTCDIQCIDLSFSSDQCTSRISSCYFSYPSLGSVPSMPLLLWSHLCRQHTYILLWPSHLSFHCLYISLLSQQVFVQPCQFPSSSTWFLMLGDRELLCFQKGLPQELSALLHSYITKDSFPGDSIQ